VVFSSHIFVFYFLPLVLGGYYLLVAAKAGPTVRHSFLTVAGMVFYGWWNPWFVLLMLGTTVLDYNLGRMIVNARGNERRRKLAVTLSVASNLSALAFFKYTAFGIETVRTIATALQWGEVSVPEFFQNIILPAGISFYVFQSLSYCIDLYRGHARPAESFIDFTCFVSLFPHLVAGPIVRYGLIADQMRHRVHTVEGFGYGIARFCTGFAKKILLANPMGPIADACFGAHPDVLSFSTGWLGLIAYAFQIYFDFSAYSDMAVGLARMLGFRFCENFDSPYKSSSITEFWRRWHMSLSTFLRDYLYIPLGGNRKGPARTYVNLMTVMLLGGLWHGASWNFILWGGLHGGMLALERWLGPRAPLRWFPRFLSVPLTFLIILCGWVFFRADNFEVAGNYFQALVAQRGSAEAAWLLRAEMFAPYNLCMLAVCTVIAFFLPNSQALLHVLRGWKVLAAVLVFVVAVSLMFTQGFNPFLYFQF
jgi:alginate O-acetyltransferase complex protein AlgI